MKLIGILGMGVVGKAIYKGLLPCFEVYGYDKNKLKSPHQLSDVAKCDFMFLCLPTPSCKDGDADISSIHEAIESVLNSKEHNENSIFVLKSTVPIGTTKNLEQKYKIKIVHCPEFLSARTAEIDFITTTRVIIGSSSDENHNLVREIFESRFPGIHVIKTTPDESELIKYFLNCFYATKISFFNEIKLLSDKLSCDWNSIMSGVLSSGWVEKMHTSVPGPDGKLGFGGACFPKDTNALSKIFKKNEIESLILDAVILQNKKIRREE